MPDHPRNKGPWIHRFLTIFFTLIFAVLWFWLLGFVVDDIGTWPGPSYAELEQRRLDPALVTQADALQRQIADTERRIIQQKARQELLRDSTANSQTTMNQLLEFQRSSLAKNLLPSADERKALAESQQRFLANQSQYQTLNEQLVQLNEQLRSLKDRQQQSEEALNRQRGPIREEFQRLDRAHDLRSWAGDAPVLSIQVFQICVDRGRTRDRVTGTRLSDTDGRVSEKRLAVETISRGVRGVSLPRMFLSSQTRAAQIHGLDSPDHQENGATARGFERR